MSNPLPTPLSPGPLGNTAPIKSKEKRSVAPKSFRGRILAGILIIIPLAVTAWIVRFVYNAALTLGVKLFYWITLALYLAFGVGRQPVKIDPAQADWYQISLAVFLTVAMFYVLGWLGSNVVGRRLIEIVETLLLRIPFVDFIYGAIKRFVASISGVNEGTDKPQRVVLIEFPSPGLRAIGFVTSIITDRNSGQRLATVYIPTAINPTSGYMEIVAVDRLLETDLTPAEAMSIILSGGASAPSEMGIYAPSADTAHPRKPLESLPIARPVTHTPAGKP